MPRAILAVLILFSIPFVARAAEVAEFPQISNGVYAVLPQGRGHLVTTVDGRELVLGRRLTEKLGDAMIWSQSNDNQSFSLNLTNVGDFPDDWEAGHAVIVIGEKSLFVNSMSGSDSPNPMQLQASFSGQELAADLADELNGKMRLREHPGHQLLTTWTPTKESFEPGEAVVLRLEIKNVGDVTVRFFEGGQQRGSRDNQFGFTAFRGGGYQDAVPDTGNPRHFGGLAGLRELEPGETFTKEISVNEWFKLTEPDTYLITGMYELDLYPADQHSRPIWHDFAVGRCSVRIVDAD